MGKRGEYVVLNYHVPVPGVPAEDYLDFKGAHHCEEEMVAGLRMGNYPPGLAIAFGSDVFLVWGNYGHRQSLKWYSKLG
jgi:hypothetical protein